MCTAQRGWCVRGHCQRDSNSGQAEFFFRQQFFSPQCRKETAPPLRAGPQEFNRISLNS
jgi:hypothetical protein